MLAELAGLGMRAARVVARMLEIEQAAADVVAGWLPAVGVEPASWTEAKVAGLGVDGVTELMAGAVPRVEALSRALDRVSRSVRRCVALRQRMAAGWPRSGADTRAAMVRRQVARGVSDAIRGEAEGEAAERLFDELHERLLDPELDEATLLLPVAEVVRRVCRDLGLVGRDIGTALPVGPRGADSG